MFVHKSTLFELTHEAKETVVAHAAGDRAR